MASNGETCVPPGLTVDDRVELDSHKAYDVSQPPFTVSVQPERSEPRERAMVLDGTLTDAVVVDAWVG